MWKDYSDAFEKYVVDILDCMLVQQLDAYNMCIYSTHAPINTFPSLMSYLCL